MRLGQRQLTLLRMARDEIIFDKMAITYMGNLRTTYRALKKLEGYRLIEILPTGHHFEPAPDGSTLIVQDFVVNITEKGARELNDKLPSEV